MATSIPNAVRIVERFAVLLNEYRGQRGRDTTRRLEAPSWPTPGEMGATGFGRDIDELDMAFQTLRNEYGDNWLDVLLHSNR